MSEEHRNHGKLLKYAILFLALCWISAEIRLRQVRQRIENLWTTKIIIKVVDAGSGAEIPPIIGTPRSTGDNLPCNWVGDIVEGSPEYTIISDKPVFIRILSDGYTQQWLEIKKDSPYRNVVRLSKK